VVALIAAAAIKLGREILHGIRGIILCAILLVAAIVSQVHPILLLVAGGVAGLLVCRRECH
jgi:chromate transport protein ChrA